MIALRALPLLAALAALPAAAAQTNTAQPSNDPSCGEVEATMRQSAQAVAERDTEIFLTYIPEPVSISARSCLDSLLSRFRIGFSFFDISRLLSNLVSGAINAACSAARSTIDRQLRVLNQGVRLPFGMGGIATRAGSQGASIDAHVDAPRINGGVLRALR